MNQKYEFDYSDLSKKIKNSYGSIAKFAKAMGYSKSSICQKLNNKIDWSQKDMVNAAYLLGISESEIGHFFMQVKFRNLNHEC